jgi:hypothetical protein
MQRRRIFTVLLVITMIAAAGCQRKGTGCPTFSISSAFEQLQKSI